MPYRRMTYLEQLWYLVKFKLLQLLQREEKNND